MRKSVPAAAFAAATIAAAWSPQPAAAGGRTIDYLAETCYACHRSGATGAIPSLTGRPGFEVIKALTEYRDGTRKHPIMQAIAADIDPAQIGMLAAYLAKQR
jgi:cytochrome c553